MDFDGISDAAVVARVENLKPSKNASDETVPTVLIHSRATHSDELDTSLIRRDRTMHRGQHREGRGALDPRVP